MITVYRGRKSGRRRSGRCTAACRSATQGRGNAHRLYNIWRARLSTSPGGVSCASCHDGNSRVASIRNMDGFYKATIIGADRDECLIGFEASRIVPSVIGAYVRFCF
jgi:hypothetical protein